MFTCIFQSEISKKQTSSPKKYRIKKKNGKLKKEFGDNYSFN